MKQFLSKLDHDRIVAAMQKAVGDFLFVELTKKSQQLTKFVRIHLSYSLFVSNLRIV